MSSGAASALIGLQVANLKFGLDARPAGLSFPIPDSYAKFVQPGTEMVPGGLILDVLDRPLPEDENWPASLVRSKAWELWLDEFSRYVFVAHRIKPPRRAIINPDFLTGQVQGTFSSVHGDERFPLHGMGIYLFVNWLANTSDLILHAAGAAIDGQGFCFAGKSGAGKSTLSARLAQEPAVTVLGEDQIILRYLDRQFWIFGTPWHVNPALCSPLGVPLKKLFFLDRDAGQPLQEIKPLEMVTRLLQTAFVPYYRADALPGILDRLALLADQVPGCMMAYQLGADPLDWIHATC